MSELQNSALYEFLKAFDDDSLSEGAWQAMIMEGVRAWNEQNGTNLDEHETWLKYIKHQYKYSLVRRST